MTRDRVTADLHARVMRRDGCCVAVRLDPTAGQCGDPWRNPVSPFDDRAATLDHVQDGYGRMGIRAPSDPAHLVRLCAHHHLNGWATSHRPLLRFYLANVAVTV